MSGDLRVNPVGDFDEDAAWKFILFLLEFSSAETEVRLIAPRSNLR